MATQTRPFVMTGAALVSAAAIVAASPAMAPSIAPTIAKSAAEYRLTTLADIFTIPSGEWVNVYFNGYGGFLGPDKVTGVPNKYLPSCNYNCFAGGINSLEQSGLSGVTYLALDALINGTGGGWDDWENWGISAVDYFFEGANSPNPIGNNPGLGLSAGFWYLSDTILANNALLRSLSDAFFNTKGVVSQVWDTSWTIVASFVKNVPFVGPVIAGGIDAGLNGVITGYTETFPGSGVYQPVRGQIGGSGVLNYSLQVLTKSVPVDPSASAAATAATVVESTASKAAVAATAETDGAEAATGAGSNEEQAGASESATSVVEAESATAASEGASTSSAKQQASSTEAGTDSSSATDGAASGTGSADSSGSKAAETESADSPSAAVSATRSHAPSTNRSADTTTSKTRKRPVRDAVQKAAKQIASALGGAKAGASVGAGSAR